MIQEIGNKDGFYPPGGAECFPEAISTIMDESNFGFRQVPSTNADYSSGMSGVLFKGNRPTAPVLQSSKSLSVVAQTAAGYCDIPLSDLDVFEEGSLPPDTPFLSRECETPSPLALTANEDTYYVAIHEVARGMPSN